jgi:tyrosyl-tRNA synthetase
MVRGESALAKAELSSRVLFGGDLEGLGADDLGEVFDGVPYTPIDKEKLGGVGKSLQDLVFDCGLATSKSESRRLIESGGIYLNNRRVSGPDRRVSLEDSIEGRLIVLRKGKKDYHIVPLQG